MVAELTENFAGWDRIKGSLDEIRACHEETLTFFNGALDRLDSMCESLLSREKQQSLLEQERPAMERELESVRSRAAEMAELLAEQKRLIDPEQNQQAEELRQMRTLLEGFIGQIAEGKRKTDSKPAVQPPSGVAAVALTDPVLESVLAQFELLQQDRLLRRMETT